MTVPTMPRVPAPDWSRGSCTTHPEPHLWHAEGPDRVEQWHRAEAVCRSCPIVAACDSWATAVGQKWGVWGARIRETKSPGVRAAKPVLERRCTRCGGPYTNPARRYCRPCTSARRKAKRRPCPSCGGPINRVCRGCNAVAVARVGASLAAERGAA